MMAAAGPGPLAVDVMVGPPPCRGLISSGRDLDATFF